MKHIILFATMFVSTTLNAQLLPKAPAPLTDSKIERTLEDGKKQEFDGNEWMIVKRHAPSKPKPQPAPIVCAPVAEPVHDVHTVEVVKLIEPDRDSVLLLGGYGPVNSLERDYRTVKLKHDAVLGGAYQHLFDSGLRGQLSGLSNETFLLGIGLDF